MRSPPTTVSGPNMAKFDADDDHGPDERRLECRVAGCTEVEWYETTDAIDASDWTRVSMLAHRRPEGWTHIAYCPDHALEQD